jgi:hypothetical protein
MSLGSYLAGMALFALVVAASLAVGFGVAARLPGIRGVARAVAVSLIATAALIAINLLPAALGILTRGTVAVVAAGTLTAAIALARGSDPLTNLTFGRGTTNRLRKRNVAMRGLTPAGVLAVVGVGALAVYLAAMLARFGSVPVTFIDTVTFHLPGVARWIQSDSIWQIDQFLPGQFQGYYPNNGNVVDLAAVLPWHSEFLSRFVNLPFVALAGVATYAAGRELAATRTSAAIAATAALSIPAVTSYIVDSPTPDAVMYAGFAAGLLFLLRHARTGERADLLLAGLGLGIAFGARWYGVAAVAVVVAVWLAARLVLERRARAVAVDLAWIALPVALAGGVWLLRNWVESGNPFYPVRVEPFGITIFDAPVDRVRDLVGFTLADYLGNGGVLSDFILPSLKIQLGFVGVALAFGVAGASVAAARRSSPDRARVLALAVATAGLVVVYLITPYTALGLKNLPYELGANVRYVIPAMIAAAPVVAWGLSRCPGAVRTVLEAILVVLALDGMRRGVDVSAGNAIAGVAIVAAVGLIARATVTALRSGRPLWAAGVVAATAAVAAVGARAIQNDYLEHRYISVTPTLDAALARAAGYDKPKIGLAGAWPVTTLSPVLALFGPDLANDVSYVGETRDGTLYPYEDSSAYAAALQHGDYDLVMVGNEKPLAFPQLDEGAWTRAAGYRQVAADENFTLWTRGGN